MTEAELQQLKEEIRTEILAELKQQVRLVPVPPPKPSVWGSVRSEAEKRLAGKFNTQTQYQIIMAISTIIRAALRVHTTKDLAEEHAEAAQKIARTILDLIDEYTQSRTEASSGAA
ncbi:hypothetical protein [Neomoorella thermoacetica]|uniref:hypothetical protein n=1 Tax=Neomoorella thermoacetica TaxID=1525 RepID=UPI0030D476DE